MPELARGLALTNYDSDGVTITQKHPETILCTVYPLYTYVTIYIKLLYSNPVQALTSFSRLLRFGSGITPRLLIAAMGLNSSKRCMVAVAN